jgi:hypothetical protein
LEPFFGPDRFFCFSSGCPCCLREAIRANGLRGRDTGVVWAVVGTFTASPAGKNQTKRKQRSAALTGEIWVVWHRNISSVDAVAFGANQNSGLDAVPAAEARLSPRSASMSLLVWAQNDRNFESGSGPRYSCPQFRCNRSSETQRKVKTASLWRIYSSSSTTRHFSRFVVIYCFQALYKKEALVLIIRKIGNWNMYC